MFMVLGSTSQKKPSKENNCINCRRKCIRRYYFISSSLKSASTTPISRAAVPEGTRKCTIVTIFVLNHLQYLLTVGCDYHKPVQKNKASWIYFSSSPVRYVLLNGIFIIVYFNHFFFIYDIAEIASSLYV